MRIALDVRVPAGQWGGIQQMVEGLARGLSELEGEDEYIFIGLDDARSWLDPLLAGPCRRVVVPRSYGRSLRRRAYDTLMARAPVATRVIGAVGHRLGGLATPIPRSDGLLESLGVDAVHFVTPQAYVTDVPSVYQVMDLLHEHLPEFFSPLHQRYRTALYRAFSDRASIISTMSSWTRSDIADRLGQPIGKIAVVGLPPAVTPDLIRPVRPAGLPGDVDRFIVYPAQTWPHKNHLGLVEAIARLHHAGHSIRLVSTGRLTDHHSVIQRRIDELRIREQIVFLGYVEQSELAWLYRHAEALVFPSRFEGWGIPIVEAFAWDLPVACSRIAVLDEVTGGAALRFAADDSAEIAAAITQLVDDPNTRSGLVAEGRRRLQTLTWNRTARTFRSLYRRAAGRPMTDDDAALMRAPTLLS